MRPDSISVWKLNTNFRQTAPDSVTLPQHFRQNGYHTEAIGKVVLHNYTESIRDNALSWSVPARFDKITTFETTDCRTTYLLPGNSEERPSPRTPMYQTIHTSMGSSRMMPLKRFIDWLNQQIPSF